MKLFRREAEFEHRDAAKEEAAAAASEARTRILGKVMTSQDRVGGQIHGAVQDRGEELQQGRADRKTSKEHKSGRAAEDTVYGRR